MEHKINLLFNNEELTVNFSLELGNSKTKEICNFCGKKKFLFTHEITVDEISYKYQKRNSIDLKKSVELEICKLMEVNKLSTCSLCARKDKDKKALEDALDKLDLE